MEKALCLWNLPKMAEFLSQLLETKLYVYGMHLIWFVWGSLKAMVVMVRILWKFFLLILSDFLSWRNLTKWAILQTLYCWLIRLTKTPSAIFCITASFMIQELKFCIIAQVFSWEKIWDNLEIFLHKIPPTLVNCGAFNPNGDLLVTGSNDKSFNVWRLSGALCSFQNDLRPTSAVVSFKFKKKNCIPQSTSSSTSWRSNI